MADRLHPADALPLPDRRVLPVTICPGGDRETIIFGILDGLQDRLDRTAPADRSRSL